MIPISTAKWDPKWYSQNGKPYIDKRGVVNGLRAPVLALPDWQYNEKEMCSRPCKNQPPNCAFMHVYQEYLNTLDFNEICQRAEKLANRVNDELIKTNDDLEIVLMVHESQSCKCAERPCLQNWFKQNGFELKEWQKGET